MLLYILIILLYRLFTVYAWCSAINLLNHIKFLCRIYLNIHVDTSSLCTFDFSAYKSINWLLGIIFKYSQTCIKRSNSWDHRPKTDHQRPSEVVKVFNLWPTRSRETDLVWDPTFKLRFKMFYFSAYYSEQSNLYIKTWDQRKLTLLERWPNWDKTDFTFIEVTLTPDSFNCTFNFSAYKSINDYSAPYWSPMISKSRNYLNIVFKISFVSSGKFLASL